ncbi:HNH endonuclease [Curtobacterium sp. MCBD17_030]|uniref:HNH endonuclease n=1 Tax=Curtobacterium sp. MCBD17_030 TaxID=2175649 RepID=UPI0015E8BDE8|nr:HNH endonuclease [Curtobacterium sp. MCBD17_030]
MELIAKSLAEILSEEDPEPQRAPIRNREPRARLGGHKWHLIYERDGGACWMCGHHVDKGTGEVDHLQPRSSFTPDQLRRADRSDNLRTACVDCNQQKSNYVYAWAPETIGVTAMCWDCQHPESTEYVEMTVPAYCGRCGHTWVPNESWLL